MIVLFEVIWQAISNLAIKLKYLIIFIRSGIFNKNGFVNRKVLVCTCERRTNRQTENTFRYLEVRSLFYLSSHI